MGEIRERRNKEKTAINQEDTKTQEHIVLNAD